MKKSVCILGNIIVWIGCYAIAGNGAATVFIASAAVSESMLTAEEQSKYEEHRAQRSTRSYCPARIQQKVMAANNAYKDSLQVVLFASHHQTAGAVRQGYSEEMWAKQVVPQAVAILEARGYRNILGLGVEEHEMDIDDACFNDGKKRIMISNHLNVGNAMLIYNDNPHTLSTLHHQFGTMLQRNQVYYQGVVHRYGDRGLDMVRIDNGPDISERYLLEWVNMDNQYELNWARNTTARAHDLANLVEGSYKSQLYHINQNESLKPDLIDGITYRTYDAQSRFSQYVSNGADSGSIGDGKGIEGVQIFLHDRLYKHKIEYQVYVQNHGWQTRRSNGEWAGTKEEPLRIEAIKIELMGDIASYYDVYYTVYVEHQGWQEWVPNGIVAGTIGDNANIESLKIQLVAKKEPTTDPPFVFEREEEIPSKNFVL